MKCILIDDDAMSLKVLENYIEKTNFLELTHSFSNAVDAINYLKEESTVDLIFLDIEMPEMTGFEFLNTLTHPPQIIIVSSREKYALDAFEYDITDFLLKPLNYARFFKAANKALESMDKQSVDLDTKAVFIKTGGSLINIKYSDILWVEALENYVVINAKDDKYTIHFTMKAIENQLPTSIFKRVHRSFIINIKAIHSIEDNTILLKTADGMKTIPIGKSFKEKLMNEINLMNK